MTVVCSQCLSVLDASTPLLTVLQQIQEAQRETPKIPLGTRGKMAGAEWEVIGFQTRTVSDSDGNFSWDEYLLFNPYKGFRYLTEYEGHWNYVTPLEALPTRMAIAGRPAVSFDGHTFRHFSGAEAATTFVLGEFPWRVTVGEKVVADDFVNPPLILSSETTDNEVTWSRGEYVAGTVIWTAFKLPGNPPAPQGTYLNQPSPYAGKTAGIWGMFGLMVAVLVFLAICFAAFSQRRVVFHNSYSFSTAEKGEPSFVTPVFNLEGRTAGLELTVHANVINNWVYFNFALINEDSGEAFDFGREVSYYTGTDSDGSYSEGGQTSTAFISAVPPGHYYLRVEPEMDASSGQYRPARSGWVSSVNYDITLRHDVPNYSWFWIAALLLLIPPIFYTIRARGFEAKRWMSSDYPPVRSRGSD